MRSGFFLLFLAIDVAGCGSSAAPVQAGDSWDPTPDYQPLEDGDVACTNDEQCTDGERCLPPESWCSEDAPTGTQLCPVGMTANECMYCLKDCGAGAPPCEPGLLCHGGFCVSPLRCSLP